ncbi:MAG: hypothetical protein QM778_17140 [Myxococcales bacterium]
MRDDQGDPGVAIARVVDDALERSLASQGPFEVEFSPTSFSEIAEMAGCEADQLADCVGRIAHTLAPDVREPAAGASEWLLVRQLVRLPSGAHRITLSAQDGPDAPTMRTRQAETAALAEPEITAVVSSLVSGLYGSAPVRRPAAPVVTATPPAQPRRTDLDARRAMGWASVGIAGALLSAGIAVGTSARHDERTYAAMNIQDSRDAARAQDVLQQAEQRARIANGLFVASAATAVLGAGLLVWGYVGERRVRAPVQVAASPSWHGAGLLVRGTFEPGSTGRER